MALERIIRYVDLTPKQKKEKVIGVMTEDGIELEPMRFDHPDWYAITELEEPPGKLNYRLYYLFNDGKIIDYSPGRYSLAESIADAGLIDEADWKHCNVELDPEDERIPRSLISQITY